MKRETKEWVVDIAAALSLFAITTFLLFIGG